MKIKDKRDLELISLRRLIEGEIFQIKYASEKGCGLAKPGYYIKGTSFKESINCTRLDNGTSWPFNLDAEVYHCPKAILLVL